MTTNFCNNSKEAVFIAQHNGQSKTFKTPNTPINRNDYVSYPFFTSQIGLNGNTSSPVPPGISINGQPGFKKIVRFQVFSGAGGLILLNGLPLVTLGNFDARNSPANQIPLGTSGSITVLSTGGVLVFALLIWVFAPRYGHIVIDSRGFSVIFLTNSASQSAPFNYQCVGQCPDFHLSCDNCCLNCADVSSKIRAISSKI